jgi:hypothetical protein
MNKAKNKVDEIFKKLAKKNQFGLKNADIEPIHPEFPFARNGICVFIAPMSSGKTFRYLKFSAIQQYLFDEPYFETIVICSTSGEFDETALTYKDAIAESNLILIKDEELLDWISEYKQKRFLYNTLRKYIRNDFKNPSDQMKAIIKENRLHNDPNRLLKYLSSKLSEIGWRSYPHRLLLIMDDYANHPLLKKKDSPLPRELRKLRHSGINVIICVQAVKDIPRDIKRILNDLIVFPGLGEEDFIKLIRETPASRFNYKTLWNMYSKIKRKKTMFRMHIDADRVIITAPDQ